MQQWQPLAEAVTKQLISGGRLQHPAWRAAFRDTPRHLFLDHVFVNDTEAGWRALDHNDPGFMDLAYGLWPVVTQLDGDPDAWQRLRDGGPVDGVATSSSSSPELMAQMLDDLDVDDAHQVLEVGTGSGYNAAILSRRLGDQQVTSIDVDATLVDRARRQLAQAGHHPRLAVTDAERTLPTGRYDRIEVTVAVRTVAPFWAAHLAPGGRIMVGLSSGLLSNALFDLHPDSAGGLTGLTLPQSAWFMPSRAAHLPLPHTLHNQADTSTAHTRDTDMPFDLAADANSDLAPLLSLALPTVQRHYTGDTPLTDNTNWNWLIDLDGSWVRHHPDTSTVTVGGPHDLWSGIEQLWHWWTSHDRPGRGRIGMTMPPVGRAVLWADNPDQPIPNLAQS